MEISEVRHGRMMHPVTMVPCEVLIYFMDTGHAAIVYQGGARTYRIKSSRGGLGRRELDASSKYVAQMDAAIAAYVESFRHTA